MIVPGFDIAAAIRATFREFSAEANRHRFRFNGEKELQDGIEVLLVGLGMSYQREEHLGDGDIVDFLVFPRQFTLGVGLAVEVKVAGSLSPVTRQLQRYASRPLVGGVALVSTRVQHRQLPATLAGKPVFFHHVSGAFA